MERLRRPDHIRQNLYAYVQGFSPEAKDKLLHLVTEKFANIDSGRSYRSVSSTSAMPQAE